MNVIVSTFIGEDYSDGVRVPSISLKMSTSDQVATSAHIQLQSSNECEHCNQHTSVNRTTRKVKEGRIKCHYASTSRCAMRRFTQENLGMVHLVSWSLLSSSNDRVMVTV